VAALRNGLASSDVATKIAAIEAVAREGSLEALPVLAAVELPSEPASAPTIIHAMANLVARGTSGDQKLAARTLSRWLEEEANRDGRDAAGNVPNLVEALGDIGGRDAIDALIAALDGGHLDLSVQTLTVERLAALGDVRARAAVVRFSERLSAMSAGDDFERQLRDEAIAEAKGALERLTI
jgi:HEAT repeat protein